MTDLLTAAQTFLGDCNQTASAKDLVERLVARIADVEAYGREYIERTDPLINCDEAKCGTCRACLSEALRVAEGENARLRDLARYTRATLHEEGLITDDEFVGLLETEGAVKRLESYDAMRRENTRLVEALNGSGLKDAESAYQYLVRLLEVAAPQCKPLPSLLGIATQIDNYIAGTVEALSVARGLPSDCVPMLKSGVEALDIYINQLRDALRAAVRHLDPYFMLYMGVELGYHESRSDEQTDAETIRKALAQLTPNQPTGPQIEAVSQQSTSEEVSK